MKNASIIFILLFLASCSQKNEADKNANVKKDSLALPTQVDVVVGIGKVEPENGIVNLASSTGGIVSSVNNQAGDSLKKGQVIVTLDHKDAALQVQQISNQIATQQQQVLADQIAIGKYKDQLEDKQKTLTTSEKLAQTGAETRQNVESLKTDLKVLQVQLNQSKKTAVVSQSKVKELRAQLETVQNNVREKTIKAPSNGVLLSINAQVGGAIQQLESFAKFAPQSPTVIHGEADEMFANKLMLGQEVTVHYIGDSHTITTGRINFLAPNLSNKSLFTDEPGEQQDRRVRQFKVLLDSTDHLLLNTKVECTIHLKSIAQ